MKKLVFTSLIICLLPLFSFTQILDPVTWSFKVEHTNPEEATLLMIAEIDEGWHLYSQDIPPGGPLPTIFEFDKNPNFKLIGKVEEPEAIKEYDPNFEMLLKFFDGKPVFKQKIKILNKELFNITGYLEFMCCDDTKCLPPTDVDFNFRIKGTGAEVAQSKPAETAKRGEDKGNSEHLQKDETAQAEASQPTTFIVESYESVPLETESDNSSIWTFFVIALLAGFAGALTPCVYPMIPMTVTFFMSSSKSKLGAKANALFYGLSIIVIYTLIGVLVTVLFGSDSIKDVSSSWITNIIFFLLFTAFAASFFGLFEIVLPSRWTNKSDKQVDKGGLIGTFFMALTLVLVSFSCTAPFIGGILVEASTGSILMPTIGMFGFSLAFALPFTILAFFPSWLSKMPKSGGWLNSVKVVLGFVILALGMKFLLVPNQALGWGLTRELFIAIWIVLFTLMGFYLLGKIKFAHDSDVKYISVPRLLLIIVTFTFVVYLLPGMIGAPLRAVSAFLPSESSFNLMEIIIDNKGEPITSNYKTVLCEEPKHGDKFKFPHRLQGYFDYEQGMRCAKELNKPVLIDFTGHGCVNCKVMERSVWPDDEVLKRLREDYIIIALYVDDRTELPEEEWITSTVDGKVKKTIGKKNADFQVARFNVNAQPYYVLLDTNENILIQPRAYDKDIDGFVEFLDRGKEAFYKNQNQPAK